MNDGADVEAGGICKEIYVSDVRSKIGDQKEEEEEDGKTEH